MSQAAAVSLQPAGRIYDRADYEVEVTVESDHNFYVGLSENISEGGLFMATHSLREVGDRMTVEFSLPSRSDPIRVACEVRWVRVYSETSDAPPGMGLRFLDLGPEDAGYIRAFVNIAGRDPLFWD